MSLDSIEDLIKQHVDSFGDTTVTTMARIYDADGKRSEASWHSGWEQFDSGVRSMRSGFGVIGGVENCGKSNFSNCLMLGILDNTKDSIAIDFILDDDTETRVHQLAAAKGMLPVDLISLPGLMAEDDPRRQQRTEAYESLINTYMGRLEIIDTSSWGGKGGHLNYIESYLTQVRERFPDKSIWVNFDAFDDAILPTTVRRDDRVDYIRERFSYLTTNLGATAPFWIMAVKHFNKGNRGRGANNDAFKGSSGLMFSAKLALTAYSEMGELGNQAQIYFRPNPNNGDKNPIFEVRFTKNKVGSRKRETLYYYQWPECYFCTEAPAKQQEAYKSLILDTYSGRK